MRTVGSASDGTEGSMKPAGKPRDECPQSAADTGLTIARKQRP
jgi:hypothetical protein